MRIEEDKAGYVFTSDHQIYDDYIDLNTQKMLIGRLAMKKGDGKDNKQCLDYSIKNVGWSIGSFCNANCVQCYSREIRRNCDLLTKEDILTVLNKLTLLGVNSINLGGNEPIFTHSLNADDSVLPFLILEAKKRNIVLGITTNGTTMLLLHQLYPEVFKMVDDWDVSLDSPFPKEHDSNRGDGFFDTAIQALELAKRADCKCSVIYCLMRLNCTQEHAVFLSKLTDKYNVDLRINTLKPTRKELFKLEADVKQIHDFFQTINRHYKSIYISDVASVLNNDGIVNCPCGKYSFAISPKKNGEIPITPCVYLQDYSVGNLLKDDIPTLLEKDIFRIFRNREPKSCLKCEEIESCSGGCLAYILLTSHYEQCDNRCPILHESITKLKFQRPSISDRTHVHENYLCTWIGENR